MRSVIIHCCLAICFVFTGCSRPEQTAEKWSPDTKRIDSLMGQSGIVGQDIVTVVHEFYEALRAKEWTRTYEARTAEFRRSVSLDLYLRSMQRDGEKWKLLNYKIMAADIYGEGKVRLVIEFYEAPGNHKGVSVVWWKKEQNGWKCEEAGPFLLNLAKRVTPPE